MSLKLSAPVRYVLLAVGKPPDQPAVDQLSRIAKARLHVFDFIEIEGQLAMKVTLGLRVEPGQTPAAQNR